MERTFYKSYGLYSLKEMEEMKEEYKREFGEELDGMDDEDLEEHIINNIEQELDIFMDEITYNHLGELECVITGVLGLWDGKHTIQPTYANLAQCITKCLRDSDGAKIYEEDGILKIDDYHHDGVNHFEINLESGLPLNLMNKIYGV